MKYKIRSLLVTIRMFGVYAATLLHASVAHAGNFGVSPLDVQFTAQLKSTVLTVTNDDAKALSLRVRAMRWTQDAEGKDVYEDSGDLVFFPKRMEMKPGDKKVVRVGINDVTAGAERAYRLYIEEIPPAETPKDGQSKLSVLLSIGVPIFISLSNTKPVLSIVDAALERSGTLQLKVKNSGMTRSRISRLVSQDGKVWSEEFVSRYIFPNIEKVYTLKVDPALCATRQKFKLETDTGEVEGALNVTRCNA